MLIVSGGRPSKYTENTLKIAADYTANYEDHGDIQGTKY
jgi:hypothetical protein